MKWSGSKDSQADKIISYFPDEIRSYYEPFVGGGSTFLRLLEMEYPIDVYIISDLNVDLINVYHMIRSKPETLISSYLERHSEFNSGDLQTRKDYFSHVRNIFNETRRPEDFYFIMRTTTNGMPRYNKKGEFNNACHFSRPGMDPVEVERLIMKYHDLFKKNKIIFDVKSYEDNESFAEDDFIYLDPPYQNTKGMYFDNFNNKEFIEYVNNLTCKFALSYDGKVNDVNIDHIAPDHLRHVYLESGNSPFHRVTGNSRDSIVKESLYLNF